jgi:hypothetical protein
MSEETLRGFGPMHWDITLGHMFHFTERVLPQFRGDFFNILNHPNFGGPINYMTSPQFGQSTQMLHNYLGRRSERRSKSSLPNWRPTLDPTGAEAAILTALKLQNPNWADWNSVIVPIHPIRSPHRFTSPRIQSRAQFAVECRARYHRNPEQLPQPAQSVSIRELRTFSAFGCTTKPKEKGGKSGK